MTTENAQTRGEPLCKRAGHQPDIDQTRGRRGERPAWLDPEDYPFQSICVYCGQAIMIARISASYWALLPEDREP